MQEISSMSRNSVSSSRVYTDMLVLNGTEATSIVNIVEKETDPKSLITASAIESIQDTVEHIQAQLDPSNTQNQDITVMTKSVIDRFFSKPTEWQLEDWAIESNVLYCLNGKEGNKCRINNRAFSKPGMYFISVTISNLPSGIVQIKLNDEVLLNIEQAGHFGVELDIDDIANDKLYLTVEGLREEERVISTSIALYFITPRFYEYLVTKISSMATVDANNFVSKTFFREEMKKYVAQFEQSANMFTEKLDEHLVAENPHHITLETIGAAAAEHTHEQYVDTGTFTTTLEQKLSNYALKSHIHDQYVDRSEVSSIIEDAVGDRFNQVMTIPPNIVVVGPTGKLPTRFMRTEINEPLTILQPSQLNTTTYSNYVASFGVVTTNHEAIVDSAVRAFLIGSSYSGLDLPTEYNYTAKPLILRNSFHSYRKIKGYTLQSTSGTVTQWKVFSGKNTFQHQIDELTDDHTYLFDEILNTDCLTFAITAIDGGVKGLHIQILLADSDVDKIILSGESFTLSIPDRGANRLVRIPNWEDTRQLIVDNIVDDLPYYLIFNYSLKDKVHSLFGTYIRPEYGEVRVGVDVLTDRFANIEPSSDEIVETYAHPALGTLRLLEGVSANEGNPLTVIYDKSINSWKSNSTTRKVVIEQTILSPSVMIRGYTLNWRESDLALIPDTWTLMATGLDEQGHENTVVVDSVEHFFPVYSAEDDDILYNKNLNINMHVTKLTLSMVAPEGNKKGLALNQFIPYLSERFYSVPENTMYRGMFKATEICLGYYTHKGKAGWVPTNVCLGTSAVIPVNDLDPTEPSTVYTIPNPFLTTSVTVSVHPYKWMDDQPDVSFGQVLNISPTEITVVTVTPAVYAVTITRTW